MIRAFFLLISLIVITSFVKAHGYGYNTPSAQCEDFGKKYMSHWDIDTAGELLVLINSCRGNGDASCVKLITSVLWKSEYDSLNEYSPLALSCRGSNTKCILWMKSKISSLNFDDPEEVKEVAASCFATDMRCVESLCQTDPSHCDDNYEYFQLARACSSPYLK